MKQNMESNKLKPTFLYEEAKRRYQELKECADKIESEIQKAPSGIIHIVNSGKRVQFYLREDNSIKPVNIFVKPMHRQLELSSGNPIMRK